VRWFHLGGGEGGGACWFGAVRLGYIAAPGIALSYPWTHFICGHLGRLATRDDVAVHQSYIADIEVFTRTTTFAIMQSLRLDKGPSGPVHP
jgi:hypothetical protein